MANHEVILSLPATEIQRADASFSISRDGEKFGTLEISSGSLVWFAKHAKQGQRISWETFAKLMESHSESTEKR